MSERSDEQNSTLLQGAHSVKILEVLLEYKPVVSNYVIIKTIKHNLLFCSNIL